MAQGVELATAYVSLAISSSDIPKAIGQGFANADKVAGKAGRSMGTAMSRAFDQTTDLDAAGIETLQKKVETAQERIKVATERSAKAQEAAERKVAIARAEHEAALAKGEKGKVAALKAADRLAVAEQKLEAATIGSRKEQEKLQKELAESKTALQDAEKAANTTADGTKAAFSGVGAAMKKAFAGDFAGAFKGVTDRADFVSGRMKEEFGTASEAVGAALNGDFKSAFATIREQGASVAKRFKSDFQTALTGVRPEAAKAADAVEGEFANAGEDAGGGFADKFGGVLKGAVGMAAAAGIGLSLAEGIGAGMEQARLGDKVAAQLGLTGEDAERAGDVAGSLYSNAYGESMEDTSNAVATVMSSIDGMRTASAGDLEDLTAKALDLSSAFDVDMNEAVGAVGVMMRNGLATDADAAMDLMVGSLQKVPAGFRDELFPAITEYGKHFQGLGMDGETAMGLLVRGAENGVIGVDKMGDAIKEFQIRSTDMSKASGEAYDAIGLDMEAMTTELLAGGPRAEAAFGQIVNALTGIEDPAAQSAAAIALFGTPLEDLGVDQIPAFLGAIDPAGDKFDSFTGAAERMGDTLNNNTATALETVKRTISTGFADVLGTAAQAALNLGAGLAPIGRFLVDTAPMWGPFAIGIGVAAAATGLWALATSGLAASAWAAAAGVWAAIAPFAPLVLAVGAFIGSIIWAFQNVGWFRDGVLTAFDAVKTGIGAAVDFIKGALSILFRGDFDGAMGVEEDSGIVGILFKVRDAALWVGSAATWLWQHAIVPAFNGIAAVIGWAWRELVKPVFDELTRFIREIIAPAATWLWREVIAPAFAGISAAVSWAWVEVIQPVFSALNGWIRDTLGPVVVWLWGNIVAPYFRMIGEIIAFVWENVIKVAFRSLEWFLKNILGPAIVWLWENVVKPNFRFIGDTIKWTWENAIRPAFDGIKRGVDLVQEGFENAADGIAKAWGAVKEAVREPVAGVVTGVINPFIRGYNGLNDHWDGPDLDPIPGFRTGGYTGALGRDDVAGVVHGDEHVIRSESRRSIENTAPGLLDSMNRYGAAALPFGGADNPGHMAPGATVYGTSSFTFPWQHAIYRSGVLNVTGSAPGWDLPGAVRMMDAATSIKVQQGPDTGDNSVYVRAANYPATWSGYYWPDDASIGLNTGNTGHLSVGQKRTIAAHELGHALGLPHAMSWQGGNGARSVMNYDTMFQDGGPTAADVAALSAIYGGAGKAGTASSPVPGGDDDGGILDGILGKLRDLVDGPLDAFQKTFEGNGFGGMALGIADKIVDGVLSKVGFGAVGPTAARPALYDDGGLIHQGVQLIDHQRSKPDKVLTDQQWNAVYRTADAAATSGGGVVELSADDRALLAEIRDAVGIELDGRELIAGIRQAKTKARDRSPL